MRVPLPVLLACFLFLPSIGTAAPTPDDPETLYMLTVKSQGLNFPGVKPWHIKASYILFDAKGQNPVNGVFEEWYVGPHRYKRSYTRAGFTQIDYGTDAGLYRSGEQKWPTREELRIPINLFEPLPDLQGAKDFTFQKADFTGDVKLRCIVLAYAQQPTAYFTTFPTFCIDPGSPVLRLNVPYGAHSETIYNRTQTFQNHYIAGELIANIDGKTIFRLTLDALERLQDTDDARFTPPSDSVLLPPGPIQLPRGSLHVLKSVAPLYPALAKAQRYEGTVNLQITVDGRGHVAKAKVIDGPRMLQDASIDAVKQWIYLPFRISGEPVEVETQASVTLWLGR